MAYNIHSKMRFTYGLSRDLIMKSKVAILIEDLDISRLMVYIHHVEEEKKK